MTKKYKNPPLVEAICEFHFSLVEGVTNFPFVNEFYEHIKQRFPNRSEKNAIEFTFSPFIDSNSQTPKVLETVDLYQFKSEDERVIVQVGENLITINHLREYSNWEIYKPIILNIFSDFICLTNRVELRKINIRAINQIEFTKTIGFKFNNFFYFGASLPKGLDNDLNLYDMKMELNYENRRDLMTIILKNAPFVDKDKIVFFFDLSYMTNNCSTWRLEQVNNWLELAHEHLNQAFELGLSEETKKAFN